MLEVKDAFDPGLGKLSETPLLWLRNKKEEKEQNEPWKKSHPIRMGWKEIPSPARSSVGNGGKGLGTGREKGREKG